MMPPVTDPLWGDLAFLVVILFAVFVWGRTAGPNRPALLLFLLGLAVSQAYDIAEAISYALPEMVEHSGMALIAVAMWIARPDQWLDPQATRRDLRLFRFSGCAVVVLGLVGMAVILGLGYPAFVQRPRPGVEVWIGIITLVFTATGMVRLGYRMAHLPMQTVVGSAAAEPPPA